MFGDLPVPQGYWPYEVLREIRVLIKVFLALAMLLAANMPLKATEGHAEETKDMSDPLAVYTRSGLVTHRSTQYFQW